VRVDEIAGVLGPDVIRFVNAHVRSLLAWDIVVYFHRNPDSELDTTSLAGSLGRKFEEVQPEIDALCEGGILACESGVVRYAPTPEQAAHVEGFVEACQDRSRRLALIALVLQSIAPGRPPV
jgi:hypothetical protein